MFKPVGSSASSAPKRAPAAVPWVEKYRPKNLNEVTAQDHAVGILRRGLESANLPHMLFYGPPGTGKTSTILALAHELYGPELMKSRVLELNASDERGISIVREKVKTFARAAVSAPSQHAKENYKCPPYKLIILDEADSMTSDAQSALRRIMENYSRITRFCLVCNYVTRIIDPIASRCSKFRFKSLDDSNALERLTFIANAENLKYEPEALTLLLKKVAGGDLRKAITLLQSAARLWLASNSAGGDNAGDDEDEDTKESIEVDEDDDVIIPDATDNGVGEEIISAKLVHDISGAIPDDTIELFIKACKGELSKDKKHALVTIKDTVDTIVLAGWSAVQLVIQVHDSLILSDNILSSTQKNAISWHLSEVDKRLIDGADEHLEMLDLGFKLSKALA